MTRKKSCFIKVMGVKNIAFQQTFATFTQSVLAETENVYKSKNKTRCFGKRSRNFNLFENVQVREFFFFCIDGFAEKKNFGSDRTSEIYDSTSIGMRTDDCVFMDREKNMTGVRHAMKNKPRVGPGKKRHLSFNLIDTTNTCCWFFYGKFYAALYVMAPRC